MGNSRHRFLVAMIALMMIGAACDSAGVGDGPFDVSEETIELMNEDEPVVGTLTRPVGPENPPVILMFHGFTGTREELPVAGTDETMFGRTARRLAEAGIASLRIDFRGSGESGGIWEDTTFSSQISDALATLDYVMDLEGVNSDRIGLLGLSQGGLVAASIADDDRVDTTVLWSPVANPPDTYGSLLGEDVVYDGLTSPQHIVMPWGLEIDLNPPFFQDLFRVDPIAEIAEFGGRLLVVVGSADDIVYPQPEYGKQYVDHHGGDGSLIVLEGDHIFSILATGPEVLDAAIDASADFLLESLD